MTAYHIVEASIVPCTRCHGRGGIASRSITFASTSWRWVAT
jgi:hypothetical protein